MFDWDPAGWPLAKFLAIPEPLSSPSSINDSKYIASAQVLAEQPISRTLQITKLADEGSTETKADIYVEE
jgi:hypothetical protein